MISKKNIILVAVLAGIGVILLVGSLTLDLAKPALPPTGDGTKWMWVPTAGKSYTWNIVGSSTDGTVAEGTSTWTVARTWNSSVVGGYGNLTGTISPSVSSGFTRATNTTLYVLNFTDGTYTLTDCNYLRNGGYLPWNNISTTAAGLFNIWIGQSVQNYTPVIKNQLLILNSSLQTWVSTQWSGNVHDGVIEFVRGRWVLSYRHTANEMQVMNWTIAQTGLVTEFLETKADGTDQVHVTFQYPGLDPSVVLSFIVGGLTVVASIGYVYLGKWKDKREAK
jgi:hypothetical protein